VDEELTGREKVEMIGHLYRLSGVEARARASELLERSGLPKLPTSEYRPTPAACVAGSTLAQA
jgi:ABC-type multidrug transport system ATPase subunit